MNKKLLLPLSLLFQMGVFAQTPIFSPASSIASYGSVYSPFEEQVGNVIDGDVATKFLDYNASDGIGFTVNLGGTMKIANSMAFTTANDFPQRDAMNYQILGSIDGDNFALITSGIIVCDEMRFNTTNYDFDNTESYSYYRLIFTNQCDTSEDMFQIAEVQLFENPLSNAAFEAKDGFTIYPNPTNGAFFVKNAADEPIDLLTITDVSGKQLQQFSQKKITNSVFNLDGLNTGIYFIQITSGSKSVVKKIVKQ